MLKTGLYAIVVLLGLGAYGANHEEIETRHKTINGIVAGEPAYTQQLFRADKLYFPLETDHGIVYFRIMGDNEVERARAIIKPGSHIEYALGIFDYAKAESFEASDLERIAVDGEKIP
ncbi:MAG: hypothetical protein ABIJ21_07800 [Nanoarchaeota archaeon]